MKNKPGLFTYIILQLFSYLFLVVGFFLLLFTEDVSLLTMVGDVKEVSLVIQQFLGSSYILLGLLLQAIKNLSGRPLYFSIASINFVGFINLYLIFTFNQLIILPSVYFALQVVMQLALFISLIEQARSN